MSRNRLFSRAGWRHICEAGIRACRVYECRAATSAGSYMFSLLRDRIGAYEVKMGARMFSVTVLAMGLRVCFWMSSCPASASATRAVFRAKQGGQAAPVLTCPDRTCLFAFDDDSAVPSVSLGDLVASDISAPASFPPAAFGTPSVDQERSALQSLFASSAAPGTVRTPGATLRAIAPKVTAKLSACVLPMDSDGVPFAFSTAVALLGLKSPSSVTV